MPVPAKCRMQFCHVLHSLWQKKAAIRIPDTILFENGQPSLWFFTAKNGEVKRKNSSNVTLASIELAPHMLSSLHAGEAVEGNPPRREQRMDRNLRLKGSLENRTGRVQLEQSLATGKFPSGVNGSLDRR